MDTDVKFSDNQESLGDENVQSDEPQPSANGQQFTSAEHNLLRSYKSNFNFQVHATDRKWQCGVCQQGGTSSKWFKIPESIWFLI